MREIKFRAWDKKKKEMELLDSFYELQRMNLTDWELLDKIFMQFTGLKDKNGKEICEGDIIKGDWSITNDIEVGEVSFYGGAFRFKPAGLPLEYGYYRKECEIIGNIYENKNLIK